MSVGCTRIFPSSSDLSGAKPEGNVTISGDVYKAQKIVSAKSSKAISGCLILIRMFTVTILIF